MQWNRSGSKEEIVEHAGWRVYTIRVSLVVSRECYKHGEIQDTIREHQKESINMRHESWGAGEGTGGSEGKWEQEQDWWQDIRVTGGSRDCQKKEEKKKGEKRAILLHLGGLQALTC